VGTYPSSIAIGDFNGDGKPDVAITAGPSAVDILLNQGDATFKLATTIYPGGDLIVADMNGDEKTDLVLSGSSVSVLLGGGNGTFQHVPRISLGHTHDSASGNSVSVADFNGDDKLDLAVTDPYANAVLILIGNGDGTFQSPIASPNAT
jgi:FG-GAP-like repeat/FG-GAP repeat